MKIKDYQKIVDETAIFPTKVNDFGLAYAYLGLIDETTELLDKVYSPYEQTKSSILGEFGDVIWYLAAISRELELNLEYILTNKTKGMLDNINHLAGDVKKYYRDKKPIDKKKWTEQLNLFFNYLTFVVEFDANDDGIDFELSEVLKQNYDKLISRKERNVIKGDGDNR